MAKRQKKRLLSKTISQIRQPHAVIDLSSRRKKARKIEQLLGLTGRATPIRLLEIGTGCGGIAHYFATHAHLDCLVDAVDVIDQRTVYAGYRYFTVRDTALPYASNTFDVVITNHVIEHVGEETEQLAHLHEVHRVLKPEGVSYLAVPNRWMAIEPHYELLGLSWLPKQLRTPYLRIRGRGNHYDCSPLTLARLQRLLRAADFRFENIATDAFRETVAIEGAKGLQWKIARLLPDSILDALAYLNPTLVFKLSPLKHRVRK